MDFNLSNEYKMLLEMYEAFTINEVAPLAQEIDEEERFPVETVEKMKALGFFGIPFQLNMVDKVVIMWLMQWL